jgi:hypothetical protein
MKLDDGQLSLPHSNPLPSSFFSLPLFSILCQNRNIFPPSVLLNSKFSLLNSMKTALSLINQAYEEGWEELEQE